MTEPLSRNAVHTPERFWIRDSGKRDEFKSGMVRDAEAGKLDYTLVFDGPLIPRLAAHLTKGAELYGSRNWMLAEGQEEAERLLRSATRHFFQYMQGELREDHFAALVFNLNATEYVLERCGYRTIQALRENYDTLEKGT